VFLKLARFIFKNFIKASYENLSLSPDGRIALAITFCAGVRHKRYSGQQETAPEKN